MTTAASRRRGIVASIVVCASIHMPAHATDDGALDHATAVVLIERVTTLVETEALPPRDEAEYADARRRVMALTATDAPVDRAALYRALRTMLATLDTDGHTLLWSKRDAESFAASTPIERAAADDVARLVDTPDGPVLAFAPPAAGSIDPSDERRYAETLLHRLDTSGATRACALVIDLRKQTGGAAWSPLAVLAPLLSDRNRSMLVDRNGVRAPLVPPDVATGNRLRLLSASAPDPLGRFRGTPIAIVIDRSTASAGETIAVALLGEPNVRSFGHRTYGATTANRPIALPDDLLLLLTIRRYAVDDAPAIRGPIEPDEVVDGDPSAVVARAAAWSAARSPFCGRDARTVR